MKSSVQSQLAADQAQLLRRIAVLERQRSRLLRLAAAHPGASAVARLMPVLLRLEPQIDHLQALAGLASAQQQQLERLSGNVALVEHVPDGDGLELADGRRVRYLGIDAPEMGGAGQPADPWALEAKALNQRLVLGRRVRLVRDVSDKDMYGRLLRYVFCDGVFVNGQMLLAGLARLMIIAPDTRYAALLARCQAAAQAARVGMWSDRA